jgi:hypothetical protein
LKKTLVSNPDVLEKWNDLTPLARNEWICWTTIVKKAETRKDHIQRLSTELLEGKRRLKKTAPLAEEIISYRMPAYKLNGILVWFAIHKKHIGF